MGRKSFIYAIVFGKLFLQREDENTSAIQCMFISLKFPDV